MIFYVTFRQINEQITELINRNNEEPSLTEVLSHLIRKKRYVEHASNHNLIAWLGQEDEAGFLANYDNLFIRWDTDLLDRLRTDPDLSHGSGSFLEYSPEDAAVFLHFLFPRTRQTLHRPDPFFEIDYVYAGSYRFRFEDREYTLKPGDLCLISPGANHQLKESGEGPHFLLQQYLNQEKFHSTFLALLSDDNIISNFFKDILTNSNRSNFLQLSTGGSVNTRYIQRIAVDCFLEQFKYDHYAPECSTDLLKILFANVLRDHHESCQFYSGHSDIDFAPVLNYLERNYRTTTLTETARVFHYSPSRLSTYIKEITGNTYTEMIRNLKMNDAVNYLLHSSHSIEEIALLVGYNNTDHFSRAFRQRYGMPPSRYRSEHRAEPD